MAGKSILGYFQKHALAVALYFVETHNAVKLCIYGNNLYYPIILPPLLDEHHISTAKLHKNDIIHTFMMKKT